MKINNLKINAYGNIEEKDIHLEKGINIIHGANESGKSTLLNYIMSSFYGISRNKDGKFLSDYEKFKPWNNSEFSGRIQYELDSGEKFEIFRDFNKKNPKIYNEKLEDITSKFEVDKRDGSKFFLEQTGVDKQMYLSTVVSMQEEVRLDEKDQNILVQKIANLAGTGEDNVSYKKALTRLQEKIRDEIGTTKTSQKPVNILEKEIKEINNKIEEINQYRNRKYEIDKEKENIEEEIKQLEIEKKALQELQDSINDEDNYKKEIEIKEKNKKENLYKITELKNEQNELNAKQKTAKETIEKAKQNIEDKKKRQEEIEANILEIHDLKVEENPQNKKGTNVVFISILVLLVIIGLVATFAIKNYILTGIIGLLIIANILTYVNNTKKQSRHNLEQRNKITAENNSKISKLQEEQNKIINEIEEEIKQLKEYEENEQENSQKLSMAKGQLILLEKNNEQIENELNIIETKQKDINYNKKAEIENKYKEKLANIEELFNIQNYKVKIEQLEEEINNEKIKVKGLEIEYNTIVPQLDEMVRLEEKLEFDIEKLEELKKQEKTIGMAIDNLTEAYEEMKNTITPKFTNNLSSSIDKISNNKYDKVTINDENGMMVENNRGEYIEAGKLSTGTIDQLYLALRLSMINDLSKEKLPIILDETFAYFDNNRLENALLYLNSELQNHQAIIFTCTNREEEILKSLDIEYNLVELTN